MNYSYHCPTKIEMGEGKSKTLPELLGKMGAGASIMLVSDPGIIRAGLISGIKDSLEAGGYRVTVFDKVFPNPRDTDCMLGAEEFRMNRINTVAAIGGGSAMDTAKAIALCGPNGGIPSEYADGKRSYGQTAPLICIPTTAGTGSEVTRSAVITEQSTHRKMTLKHANLRPQLAVLDPELTLSVPPDITAATGVDALVHAIEGYTCRVSNPISQALGASAISKIVKALPLAYQNGENRKARAEMLEGSLLAGLCFGSADVAAVHCLAEALGGLYDTPHGVANAIFLPHVLEYNISGHEEIHGRIARIAGFAAEKDSDEEAAEKLIKGIVELTDQINIPKLKQLPGVKKADFERIVELSMNNNSTSSNVKEILPQDYLQILEKAYSAVPAVLSN